MSGTCLGLIRELQDHPLSLSPVSCYSSYLFYLFFLSLSVDHSSLYFQLPLSLSFSVISSLLEGKVETSSISVNKKGKAM
uniref:Uncharacterized protein n=1 Tax=Salix viminalis TaxID=40686 RepID=A0A6N2M1Q0_SALVM